MLVLNRYPNEIIEMPVLLLRWSRIISDGEPSGEQIVTDVDLDWELKVEDEYRSYVRPKWRPNLSDFCKRLTGIQQVSNHLVSNYRSVLMDCFVCYPQSDINSAPTYPEMLKDLHDNFILKHNLFQPSNKTVWVTDGPWGESIDTVTCGDPFSRIFHS